MKCFYLLLKLYYFISLSQIPYVYSMHVNVCVCVFSDKMTGNYKLLLIIVLYAFLLLVFTRFFEKIEFL